MGANIWCDFIQECDMIQRPYRLFTWPICTSTSLGSSFFVLSFLGFILVQSINIFLKIFLLAHPLPPVSPISQSYVKEKYANICSSNTCI
jgi:hypothetical protein